MSRFEPASESDSRRGGRIFVLAQQHSPTEHSAADVLLRATLPPCLQRARPSSPTSLPFFSPARTVLRAAVSHLRQAHKTLLLWCAAACFRLQAAAGRLDKTSVVEPPCLRPRPLLSALLCQNSNSRRPERRGGDTFAVLRRAAVLKLRQAGPSLSRAVPWPFVLLHLALQKAESSLAETDSQSHRPPLPAAAADPRPLAACAPPGAARARRGARGAPRGRRWCCRAASVAERQRLAVEVVARRSQLLRQQARREAWRCRAGGRRRARWCSSSSGPAVWQ